MPLTARTREFIKDDLYHELRCLLGATTVWRAFRKHERGFDVVIAMDSSFVHARCLLEFFTRQKGGNDVSVTELGPASPYTSPLYNQWCEPLNRHVLHISPGRTTPSNIQNGTHLNELPEELAREVLGLWKKLEDDTAASAYSPLLRDARKQAVADAELDANGRIAPLFTF